MKSATPTWTCIYIYIYIIDTHILHIYIYIYSYIFVSCPLSNGTQITLYAAGRAHLHWSIDLLMQCFCRSTDPPVCPSINPSSKQSLGWLVNLYQPVCLPLCVSIDRITRVYMIKIHLPFCVSVCLSVFLSVSIDGWLLHMITPTFGRCSHGRVPSPDLDPFLGSLMRSCCTTRALSMMI